MQLECLGEREGGRLVSVKYLLGRYSLNGRNWILTGGVGGVGEGMGFDAAGKGSLPLEQSQGVVAAPLSLWDWGQVLYFCFLL